MGFLDALASPLERKSAVGSTKIGDIEEVWGELYRNPSKSGASVTHETALRVTTVLACCARIAEGNSTVPLKLYQKEPAAKDPRQATELKLNDVLESVANDHQNSLEYREQISYLARLTGSAYSFINRVRGEVAELIPFEAGSLAKLDRTNREEWRYTFRLDDGTLVTLPQHEVWHFRGPGWKTYEGFDATRVCREAIGLSIAAEESQSMLHANGAQPGGLISFKERLSKEGVERLKATAKERLEGLRNAFRTLVLDGDAQWTPFQMNGVDSQHLETRRFQVEEICRGLGVLPIMVGHADKTATYASAEQFFLHHVVHTVRPWHRRIEYSADHQLLTEEQRRAGFYFRFTDTELLRGDHKTRGEYYKTAIEAGWMKPEEPRAFEDMPWVEGLDRPRISTNYTIVDVNGRPIPMPKLGGGNADRNA